jgi:hypothetical protein
MSKETITIDLGIIGEREVEVEFTYHAASGDGWNEPHYDEELEIEGVTMEGKDIYWMFDDSSRELLIEALQESRS